MPDALSYDLHKLTARLDRLADEVLRRTEGVSYARFLALFAVRNGVASQRELATWLGQAEPSTSRMVGVLVEAGLLEVTRVAGAGNRRSLQLSAGGAALVDRCARFLEARFEDLVARSGVVYEDYHRATRMLLTLLDAPRQPAIASLSSA